MIDVDRYLTFLETHQLSERQFFVLLMLRLERADYLDRYKDLFPIGEGTTQTRPAISNEELQDLIERKMIKKVGRAHSLANYKLLPKIKEAFITNVEAAFELLDAYPPFAIIPNKGRISLTLMDSNKLAKEYGKRIKFSMKEHEEVLKDLEYAKQKNMINYGIEKFVTSNQWTQIRKLRLDEEKDKDDDSAGGYQTFNV